MAPPHRAGGTRSAAVWLNLPNLLTLFRILLVPVIVAVLLTRFEGREFVGLGLFLLAALTDFLDGFLARRRRQVTRLGKLLDPAADKILTTAAFIALVEIDPLVTPAWMVALIVSREFAVSTLRSVAAVESMVIAASWSGKVKTVTQVVAISLLIIYTQLGEFSHLAPISLWVALLATLYSGVEYFVRYWRLLTAPVAAPPDAR
ncbi:MAG: CDP-diacylglycerol--glycerol-3-phosphate 3-phosphatidyltransferase [Thermoanaerobaculia bacterium]|nr:CDP-diacylglycerol--glycerol-3-phosphate 3-phosphatidyltransferase [Thermoanaerobaculia bacterium]MCZ7650246.1 CDP-diacylglycerol--glycerol-3-phosphate 3-phosphatidyltransferase [Thermoanaerobaculia bacterium]